MPYTLKELQSAFPPPVEAPKVVTGEITPGVACAVSTSLKTALDVVGGGRHDDPSRQDSSLVTKMLQSGLSPQDAYATFAASARGRDAERRKASHYDDYLQRTIRAAMGFLGKTLEDYDVKESDDLFMEENKNWRDSFSTVGQLDSTPLEFVADRFIPEEGVTGIGGLSGHGKTWVMLSLAKAICCGSDWLGILKTKKYPILYLTPECGDRSFHRRASLLRIPTSKNFLVRTMSKGNTLPLDSEVMKAAVKGRVVFLDTLTRFVGGRNEQTAQDMAQLSETIRGLLIAGAIAVIFAHHSPKFARGEDEMNLENVFRGSGDIGANLDSAHAVRVIDAKKVRIQIENVKARDYEPLLPLQVEGKRSSNPPSQAAQPVLKCGYGSSDERSHGKTTDTGRDSTDCVGVCK